MGIRLKTKQEIVHSGKTIIYTFRNRNYNVKVKMARTETEKETQRRSFRFKAMTRKTISFRPVDP